MFRKYILHKLMFGLQCFCSKLKVPEIIRREMYLFETFNNPNWIILQSNLYIYYIMLGSSLVNFLRANGIFGKALGLWFLLFPIIIVYG